MWQNKGNTWHLENLKDIKQKFWNMMSVKYLLTILSLSGLRDKKFLLKSCQEQISCLLATTSLMFHCGYLSAFWLVLQVGGGPDLGLYILQVRQGLIDNLQLPLGRWRRLGRGSDHSHLLLLEGAEGFGCVAAGGARARSAAGVAGGRARCDGGGSGGGRTAADWSGTCGVCALREEQISWLEWWMGTKKTLPEDFGQREKSGRKMWETETRTLEWQMDDPSSGSDGDDKDGAVNTAQNKQPSSNKNV